MAQAVDIVKAHGARDMYLTFVHPVLSGRAVERLAALPIKEIVTTNTIPIPPQKRLPNMTILSIWLAAGRGHPPRARGATVGEMFNE